MVKLSVNIDHVAILREAGGADEPDPIDAAVLAQLAGADGVSVHLTEDRGYISDRDLKLLRQIVRSHLNLEITATGEMVETALEVRPDMVTLVPENREMIGVGGGLNVVEKTKQLEEIIGSLHHSGILVSLFIDPDLKQVKEASRLQADYVELHTGGYANARNLIEETEQLGRLKDMAMAGEKLGLGVKVGCGLTYQNVARIIEVPQIEEISIGHAIISRALLVGMEKAVRDMIELVRQARR